MTINGYNEVSNVTETFMFTIESPVIGADSKAYKNGSEHEGEDFTEILVGEVVTFNMSIVAGTSIKVTWNFKDGSPKETYELAQGEAWPTNGYQVRTHNFTKPGCYFVEVIVENNFDTYTFSHRVCVYNKVDCLELSSNTPRGFENLKAPTELFFTTTCHPPTLAQVIFDYGDQTTSEPLTAYLKNENVYEHDYLSLGM